MNYLDLDLLENPYGKRVGGGYDTVRVGSGGRLHIQGRDGGPLCMQGRKTTDLRASTGRVVDCYRCIKILAMESNAPYIRRELTTAKGEKKSHFMVPGGRQGQLVADKKASPSGMSGVAPFKRGPTQHPTQPWMTKRVAMAKTYEERLRDEGVALPPYFLPPTLEEKEAAQAFSYYASPKAKRRAAAAARRAGGAAAAAEAAQVANPKRSLAVSPLRHRAGFKHIPAVRAALVDLGVDLPSYGWTNEGIAYDPAGFLSDAGLFAITAMNSLDRPGRRKRADVDAVHRLEEALDAAGASAGALRASFARKTKRVANGRRSR